MTPPGCPALNCLAAGGQIFVGGVGVARAKPRDPRALRREVLSYVAQALRWCRVCPRWTW